MKRSFLLIFSIFFIASCSMLCRDEEIALTTNNINLETTKIPPSIGKDRDVRTFNQKIITAFNKKESWALHAPEVIFQYLGRDISANFTTVEFKSQPEQFDYIEVDLIKDGLLNDMIKSERTTLTMKKLSRGYWQLVSATVFTECFDNKDEKLCQ